MIRKELYDALALTIRENIPEIRHIDLWNYNVEFIEQEDMWERPAVFVEFGPISWESFNGRGQRGRGTIRLHTVTDWVEGGHESAFAISTKLYEALQSGKGNQFDSLSLIETLTNHNHEDVLESIDTYQVRYLNRQ